MTTSKTAPVTGAAALLAAAALALAAPTSKPDFSGRYVIDMHRTKLQLQDKVLQGMIVLEHREPSFKFHRVFQVEGQAKPDVADYEVTTDGREKTVTEGGTTEVQSMIWDGDALVFHSTITAPRGTATDTVRYHLEDGGKTLICEESFRGPRLQYDNTWVAVVVLGDFGSPFPGVDHP